MNKNQNFTKLLISLILYLGFCSIISAQNLNLSSISTNGSVNVIVQDSTTIYLGGSFSAAGYKTTGTAKINSRALSSFAFPSVQGQCYAIVTDGSGGWYVGGSFSVQGLTNLAHILSDNTIDVSFAPNPNSTVNALYLDGTTLYVGGSFSQISSQTQSYLAAIDATSGSLQNWNPNPDGEVNSITKDVNIVYVGGSFQNIGGRESRHLAAVDATTGSANPFISASSTVTSIEQDATNLYLGGSFYGASGYYTGATSLLTTASDLPDFTFPIINGSIAKSIPDGSGGWYVGGSFSVQGLTNLAHILSDNTIDVSFAPNPNSTVNALYLDGTTLYVGGSFSQISSQTQSYLAAIDATSGSLQNWNPNPDGGVNCITKAANIVYVGGFFQNIGGRESRCLAAVDATTGSANPFISASSTVTSIEQDATNLYLGGSFNGESGYYTGATSLLTTASDLPNFTFPIINGSIAKSIPDGNGGWYVGGNFSVQGISNLIHILSNNTVDVSFAPNPNSTVNALHLDGTTLYVGGSFSQIGSQNQRYLAAIDATSGSLQNWNPNPDGGVNSITKDGNIVYVGGSFQNIGGRESRNLAAVDVTTGSANPFISVSSTVNSIEQDATNLYLGGSFSGANGYYTGANSLLTTTSDLPNFTFPIINGSIAKSIPDGNGGWYVGGDFSVQGISNLIHILSNNTVDLSFVPNPNSTVNALHLDGTTLYVGGSFSQISSQTQSYLAAIDATSGVLQNWNPNPDAPVSAIKLIGTTVYVGGSFTTIGGQGRNYLAALNQINGTATAWNPNADAPVTVLEINGTEIIVGGTFSNIGGQNRNFLAALSVATGNATTWNPNPDNQVQAIELNGANAYIGGYYFSNIGGQPRNNIAEISLSTGNATTWNPNADAPVSTIKLIGTTVYVGGSFTTIGGQSRNYLAALNNTNGNASTWNPTPNGTIATISVNGTSVFTGGSYQYLKTASRNYLMAIAKSNGLITTWNPNPSSPVDALELNGMNAYAGGSFSTIGGQPRNYIAEISLATGNATTWNPNANWTVSAIKLIGTTIYAGGSFTTIGGQSRNYLAALNNTNGNATTWNPIPNGTIATISVNGTSVFTGGSYQYLKTASRNYLMAIAKSNGLITTWNPSPNSPVHALELNGTNAYAGGSFTTIGGQTRNYIAEISLSTGNATTWNPNADGAVSAIKLIGTTIYAGGSFTTIGGQSRNYLAALNNTNGNATTWNPIPNGTIATISVNGTSVFTGGSYQYLKTASRNYLMAIAKSNGLITTWNPNPDNQVQALELNGMNAYAGGSFTTIGGQPRNYIAEISLSTGNATTWNPNANSTVNAVKLIGTTIYAGGSFTTIGGQSRNYLAALNQTNGTATAWNPKPDGAVYKIRQANTDVIAIGAFSFMNSEQRSNLIAISKSTGLIKSWSPNPNSTVETIEMNGTNAYIGGSFTTVGGQPRNNIAEISLSTGNATTWNPDANSTVNDIKRLGTSVFVGGSFTSIGGQTRNYLASLNTSNGNANAWNPNANTSIKKLEVSDSILYVAGDYSTISSQSRNRLCSFTLPNGNLTNWNPDVNSSIFDLKTTDSRIYIAGYFSEVSGQSRTSVASFNKSTGDLTKWNPSVSGYVSSILPKGKLVFCGGGMNVLGGQTCNGFGAVNANTGIPELFFPKVTGQINSMLAYDSLIYLGGSITSIDDISYGGLASIAYPTAFFKSEIEDYSPKKGGNSGEVTLQIQGNGFEEGTKVKLTKSGQPNIILKNLIIEDGITISGVVDLKGAVIGDWNVVVEIPNDTVVNIINGFQVEQGSLPQPWAEVVGFERIRVGQEQTYTVTYGNKGNVDAKGVPIWVIIGKDTTIEFKSKVNFNTSSYNNTLNLDSIPKFFIVDTLYNSAYQAIIFPVYISRIAPNEVGNFSFSLKTKTNTEFEILAFANPTYYDSQARIVRGNESLAENVKGCISEVINNFEVGDLLGLSGCIKSEYELVTSFQTFAEENSNFNKYSLMLNMANTVFECTPIPAFRVAKATLKLANGIVSLASHENCIKSAWRIGTQLGTYVANVINGSLSNSKKIQTVNSFDPNDKLGPIGEGSGNYLNVKNRVLPYIIRCENAVTASAAAQTVLIIDSLDKKVFDLSTFQLGFFSIADSIIPIPSGLKNYETDIDLRPANNIIARVKANLDMQSGVATWEFTSLDPSTLEPTINPVAGFLPPNVNKPDGEAAVMYSIKALSTIPDGAQIKNKAYIYFDANKPIITNEWVNANDIVKPISSMKPLSEKYCGDSTIVLKWNRSDKVSGVKSCDIYYKVNNGNFELLQSDLTEDSLIFTGSFNTNYSFFSIAKDSVGNQENIKTKAETKILFLPIQRKTNFQTICKGEVYQINGKKYTLSGTYEDIFKSKNGCDSIVKTILKVIQQSTFKEIKHICQGASYNGYSSTGVYTKKLKNYIGCDSNYTLDLKVHAPIKKVEKKTVCYGSTYKGQTKTGTYYFNYKTSYGCDSIEQLDLEVLTRDTTVLTKTICKGEKYDGYGEAGSYIYKKKNSLGCDSVVSLTLNVRALPKVTLTFREKLCSNTGVFQLDSLNAGIPKGGVFTGDHVQEENLFDPKGLSGAVALTYTYTDEFGCAASITKNVQLSEANGTASCKVGGVNEKVNSTFSIYPNPTNGFVSIKVSANLSVLNYTVTITDVVGKQLQTTKLLHTQTDISLRNLGAVGVYMVNVYDTNGQFITCQRVVLTD